MPLLQVQVRGEGSSEQIWRVVGTSGIAFVAANSVNPFFKLSKASLKRLGDLAEILRRLRSREVTKRAFSRENSH